MVAHINAPFNNVEKTYFVSFKRRVRRRAATTVGAGGRARVHSLTGAVRAGQHALLRRARAADRPVLRRIVARLLSVCKSNCTLLAWELRTWVRVASFLREIRNDTPRQRCVESSWWGRSRSHTKRYKSKRLPKRWTASAREKAAARKAHRHGAWGRNAGVTGFVVVVSPRRRERTRSRARVERMTQSPGQGAGVGHDGSGRFGEYAAA